MFEPTSRYAGIETATRTAADGRAVVYKRRRFLPQPADMPVLAEVLVAPGDRIDTLAARVLGDPEQFWRLADANGATNPADLAVPGRRLRVAVSPG